jgi:hypothetical protein
MYLMIFDVFVRGTLLHSDSGLDLNEWLWLVLVFYEIDYLVQPGIDKIFALTRYRRL